VNKPLARKEIKKLVPAIEELVDDLLNKATEQPIELVSALAVPLPVMIIARVLGVPSEDYQRFKAWSDAVVATDAPGPTTSAAVREMYAYFREVFASRRASPLDDLISVLIHTDGDDEPFDEGELLDICHVVLVAGNQTTLALIGNLMNILVDHPDVWTRIREDRSLVDLAVEEGLRFDSPLQLLWRRSVRDVMVRGVTIPEGSTVGVMYGSANRDDDEFLDADSFLLSRELGKHLAFGHGIHYCMGAPLARMEIRAVLNGLLDRYASLERAEEPTRLSTPGFTLRGFERLPIHFY
jgi:cytochrome P450